MTIKAELWGVLSLIVALGVAGCGDEDEHSHDEHGGVYEEACEHMEFGPTDSVLASETNAGPDISEPHVGYDVALMLRQGDKMGSVSFNVAEAGDYVVFLDTKDVPLTVESRVTGETVTSKASEDPFEACSAVALSYTYALEVGQYVFNFGPTPATFVGVVVERVGEE